MSESGGVARRPGVVVYKFGGSSVADAERIGEVARLICEGDAAPVVVVVSALGGVTDRLARMARAALREGAADAADVEALRERHREVLEALCPEGDERTAVAAELDGVLAGLEVGGAEAVAVGLSDGGGARLAEGAAAGPAEGAGTGAQVAASGTDAERTDALMAVGEDLSARLVACAVRARGRDARLVDAREVVRTDERFGRARPQTEALRALARERLLPLVERGTVPVVQGFVGATADGRTTTLGRGGSDFTAVLLGAALDARRVDIWTDVDGILSGDPRSVEHARVLDRVGFEEAVELSYFGARVIHPSAAKHAVSERVPLRIRNTFNADAPGTLIVSDEGGGPAIAAIAYKPRVVLIKVRSHPTALQYGFLARVFEVLGRHQVPVDLVATSHSSTAFTIDEAETEVTGAVAAELSAFADVKIVRGLATLTVVGQGLLREPGIDALVFWAVEKTPVHLISQASDVSLSFLVAEADAAALVRKLHHTLIELRDPGAREGME